MVFPSLPPYLDSSNWHHQHISHHIIGSSDSNPSLPPQAPPLPPPPQQPHGGPGSGSIRPGSMSERARQANIPMPEPAQRCPRCDSTNTKFCYFNNYSLTQPRHFCKTCRRYWTRGGALRSVPVGGGCRRNKRSSKTTSSSSKSSPASSASDCNRRPQTNPSSTSSVSNTVPYSYGGGLSNLGSQFQPMRFMSQLSQLSEGGFTGEMMNLNSYVGGHNNIPSDYQGTSNFLGFEQWKLQQFPFLGGLDLSPGAYEFQGDGQKISSSMISQLGTSVKMEESKNPAGLSLMSRELSGGMHGSQVDNQWNINMNRNEGGSGSTAAADWTHLSSFASSSTSNHLQ